MTDLKIQRFIETGMADGMTPLRHCLQTQANSKTNPFESGFIDTISHHTKYIKCAQLGTFQNIGPQGERDFLKKVLVNVQFGEVIADPWIQVEDITDCSRLAFRYLNLKITDVSNIALNLHGQ
jgi:hypothetical protein